MKTAHPYPAPDPTTQQISGAEMLSRFLQRNDCAAMTRDGDLMIMVELDKVDKYKTDVMKEILLSLITPKHEQEFEKEFKKAIKGIAELLDNSRKSPWNESRKPAKNRKIKIN